MPSNCHNGGIIAATDCRCSFRERPQRPCNAATEYKCARHAADQQYDADHQNPPEKSVGLDQECSFGKFDQEKPRRTTDRSSHGHNGISISCVVRNLQSLAQTNRWFGDSPLEIRKEISLAVAVVQSRLTAEQIRKLFAGVGLGRNKAPPD